MARQTTTKTDIYTKKKLSRIFVAPASHINQTVGYQISTTRRFAYKLLRFHRRQSGVLLGEYRMPALGGPWKSPND
jgi:hypothetical protein